MLSGILSPSAPASFGAFLCLKFAHSVSGSLSRQGDAAAANPLVNNLYVKGS
ncbi:hypothetical protein BN439_0453 [Erwinia amylovora Ea644]|nr:hypothetical protein BN439_0453 [Erwinia amylovora Ea644]CCP05536.1 hypothetical protein BN440_0484 [Erwinia amylovora MR1]